MVLKLCLYGTRDAAKGWQEVLSEHLVENGFERGRGFPSVFYHRERDICTLVHGDDYFSAGKKADLDWLQMILEKRYELKSQRIGGVKARSGKAKSSIASSDTQKKDSSTKPIRGKDNPLWRRWK